MHMNKKMILLITVLVVAAVIEVLVYVSLTKDQVVDLPESKAKVVLEQKADEICNPSFSFEDIGPVVTLDEIEDSSARGIADTSVAYMPDGRIRAYFSVGGVGIMSSISDDGINFELEEGTRLSPGNGMPKIVTLDDGTYRMFFSTNGGTKSAVSDDGFTFTIEDGYRVTNEQIGFEDKGYQIGKFAMVELASGLYRGYMHELGVVEITEKFARSVPSAWSEDMLAWEADEGVRVGGGADVLSTSSREASPYRFDSNLITLFYVKDDTSEETGIFYSTSEDADGLEFAVECSLDLEGASPFVLQLKDGSYLMYHDVSEAGVNYVMVGRLEVE